MSEQRQDAEGGQKLRGTGIVKRTWNMDFSASLIHQTNIDVEFPSRCRYATEIPLELAKFIIHAKLFDRIVKCAIICKSVSSDFFFTGYKNHFPQNTDRIPPEQRSQNMIEYLLPALVLNAVIVIAIVELIYRRYNKSSGHYIFIFYTFSVLMVFIAALLRDIELSVGVGFGLFAIFSLLRYRTDIIPLKQMTYIFVFITIPFMNTLYLSSNFTLLVIILNTLVFSGILVAEITTNRAGYSTKKILYNELDLLKPQNSDQLIADLIQKTGLDIQHVEYDEINLVRQTAKLTIFYRNK